MFDLHVHMNFVLESVLCWLCFDAALILELKKAVMNLNVRKNQYIVTFIVTEPVVSVS